MKRSFPKPGQGRLDPLPTRPLGVLVGVLTLLIFGVSCTRREAAVWSQPDECRVKEMRRIGSSGGGLDWSPTDNDLILITKYDEHKIKQIYTIRPDGTEETCLTCTQRPGGPAVSLHKGVPHWHPSGKTIFLQVETEGYSGVRSLAEPESGLHNDLWATTLDGSQWWRLTDYSENPEAGVLFPVPSHDGKKLAWTERYAGPDQPLVALIKFLMNRPTEDLFGKWRLHVADLVIEEGGVRLENIETYQPGAASFYEMQTWSPADDKIYFAASINRTNVYVLDIWSMDLATQQLTAITDTDDEWEEHLSFSPSGNKITFMSSACCAWKPNELKTLRAELYLMDADGSHKVQLTHFNSPGYSESSSEQSVVASSTWSPDGTRVAMQTIRMKDFGVGQPPTDLWILTFAGACGAL